jgi:hypothetical protein
MRFHPAPSALCLFAALSACSIAPPNDRSVAPTEPPTATPAPVAAPTPAPEVPRKTYRAGIGTVESASIVSLPSSPSAAGGGTTGPTMGYWLRMDDGTAQSVVQAGERFAVGDRVEITPDGRLIRR